MTKRRKRWIKRVIALGPNIDRNAARALAGYIEEQNKDIFLLNHTAKKNDTVYRIRPISYKGKLGPVLLAMLWETGANKELWRKAGNDK